MSVPPVPHVKAAALVGDTALIRGYAAEFIGLLLDRYPNGGLEALVARSGVPLVARREIVQASEALKQAGAVWRLARATSATSGSAIEGAAVSDLPSQRHVDRLLTARDAGLVLGISDRQVRSLAATSALPGRRAPGGRWAFQAVDIEAELKRRQEAA